MNEMREKNISKFISLVLIYFKNAKDTWNNLFSIPDLLKR